MGGPGTYGLNRGSSESDTFSQVIQFSTREEKSFIVGGIRGDKHTLDAGIHPYNASLSFWFRNFFLIAKKQIHLIFNNFKFRILPSIDRNVRMVHLNWFTPEGNTTAGFVKVPFPDQREGSIFKDGQFPSLIGLGGFVSGSDMLADTASKLRGKIEFFTKDWIISFGKAIRVQFFGIEGNRGQPIKGMKIIENYFWSFTRARDFDFCDSDDFHYGYSLIYI
jgi:hypothetical protein